MPAIPPLVVPGSVAGAEEKFNTKTPDEGHGQSRRPCASKGSKRRAKQAFPYGNYDRYYGYRLRDAADEDPRAAALDMAWLQGRRVIDVGCNEGVLTLSLAVRAGTRSMLGIDIDGGLIRKACRSLARLRREYTRQLTAAPHERGSGAPGALREARRAVRALVSTRFVAADAADAANAPTLAALLGRADTILCLSVTKWVHLNCGDDGVRRLLARLAAALWPGGVLVLEPQPWRSYRAVLRKPATAALLPHRDLSALHFRPADFRRFLERACGLAFVAERRVDGAAAGFERPLLVFRKPVQPLSEGPRPVPAPAADPTGTGGSLS